MTDDLRDYLAHKAKGLGLERQDVLAAIQARLDEWFTGRAHAQSLNGGVLHIAVASAALASELRFKNQELMQHHPEVTRVRISIGPR